MRGTDRQWADEETDGWGERRKVEGTDRHRADEETGIRRPRQSQRNGEKMGRWGDKKKGKNRKSRDGEIKIREETNKK